MSRRCGDDRRQAGRGDRRPGLPGRDTSYGFGRVNLIPRLRPAENLGSARVERIVDEAIGARVLLARHVAD